VVIFSPSDLLLIQGAPSLRRRFLDLVVTQIMPQHAADLHDYSGILNQRNNLLRQGVPPAPRGQPSGASRSELDPWDEQLVFVGARIISRRLAVFKKLLGLSQDAFASLSHSGGLDGVYVSQVIPPRSAEDDEDFCRQAFRDALERRRGLDERLRMTTTGPHRDDLCFFLGGHEAHLYCSQGEQRLIALALKLAQSRLLSSATASEALLLLDDVFSELDEGHREKVLQELAQKRQVIATTTSFVESRDVVARQLTPEISLFRMHNCFPV
jgi:DNA replication and repair protein RecF